MIPEELAEMKSLCAKATPGPWTRMGGTWPDKDHIIGSLEESPPQRHHIFGESQHTMRDADVSFISAARTAVPDMIAEIERLQKELALVRRVVNADNERVLEAGERVGLYFGCATVDAMADEIEKLRKALKKCSEELCECDTEFLPGCHGTCARAIARKALGQKEENP